MLRATAACNFSTSELPKVLRTPGVLYIFTCKLNVFRTTAACNFSTSKLQKVVRDRQFFNILTCECASRHSGVQFFHIRTSKSAPKLTCFAHFDFKMCFSPQRRAIFDFSGLLNTYLRTRRFNRSTFRLTRHTDH